MSAAKVIIDAPARTGIVKVGIPGPPGPQGPQGAQGPAGPAGAGGTVTTIPTAVDVALGEIVTWNTSGEWTKAVATTASGLARVLGIVSVAATTGNNPEVLVFDGQIIAVLFSAAPPASRNGLPVYLSATTAGRATHTAPSSAGEVVLQVGILQNADGVSTTPLVLLRPRKLLNL